jgi:putative oxidoreductase
MLRKILKTDKNYGSLFLRLGLGIVFFPHGAQKVLGWFGGPGFSKTLQIFQAKMHFPIVLVILLMITEFVGSLCLIAGLFTRIWAIGIGISITICAYMNHLKNGFFMNWFGIQKGEGVEYHILAVALVLGLIVLGGGGLSLDRAMSGE